MATCYETVREIFNQCPNNQMRDIYIDEIVVEDTDLYIKNKFRDREVRFEKTMQPDGTVIYDIFASGIHERYSFTPV